MRYRFTLILIALVGVIAQVAPGVAAAVTDGPPGLTIVLSPTRKFKAFQRLDLAVSIVEDRIDRLGVANASVSRGGTDIVVHLPGVTDPDVAQGLVDAANLQFRPVIAPIPPDDGETPSDATSGASIASCDVDAVAALASVPTTPYAANMGDKCVVLPIVGDANSSRYYLGKAGLTGKAVDFAKAEYLANQGWIVRLALTRPGSKQWDQLGRQQFHKRVAIVLDAFVQSAPLIQPSESTFTSFGGNAVISGRFSQAESQDLAKLINYGSVLNSDFKVKSVIVN